MEETRKEVMLKNCLTQWGIRVGSVKKLKMPSALGRHRDQRNTDKNHQKVSKHYKLCQNFHI